MDTGTNGCATHCGVDGFAAGDPPKPRGRPRLDCEPCADVADLKFTLTFPFLKTQPEPQRAQVARLSQQTGLNFDFAVDCLQQNGWDHERAMANFEQVKVRETTASGSSLEASASRVAVIH